MLRAVLRRNSGFGSMVLEVAFGLAVVTTSLGLASWYDEGMSRPFPIELGSVYALEIEQDPDDAAIEARVRREEAAVSGVPGVAEIAQIQRFPFLPPLNFDLLARPGHEASLSWMHVGSWQVLDVLGMRPYRGRALTAEDATRPGPRALVITKSLGRALFGDEDPLGKQVQNLSSGAEAEIVGLIEDLPLTLELAPHPNQAAFSAMPAAAPWRRTRYLVRGTPALAAPLKAALISSGAHWARVRSLDELRASANQNTPGASFIMRKLAYVVVALALMSSLGMSAFLVNLRAQQIGIMRALGATRGDIARYFLIENFLVTSLGVALGVVGVRVLSVVTTAIDPAMVLDPRFALEGALMFWLVGLAAAAVPAMVATRIPPGSRP
ncbi:MAG: FtsX-like permease family protein [Myxococcota bacterium]